MPLDLTSSKYLTLPGLSEMLLFKTLTFNNEPWTYIFYFWPPPTSHTTETGQYGKSHNIGRTLIGIDETFHFQNIGMINLCSQVEDKDGSSSAHHVVPATLRPWTRRRHHNCRILASINVRPWNILIKSYSWIPSEIG